MERLTEKRDGQNVIPLRQNGKIKWSICSAGLGDAPTKYLYGDHADRLAAIEDILGDDYELDRLREAVEKQEEYEQFMGRWKQVAEIAGAVKKVGAERAAELVEADRDGWCGVPPVKLHQRIYRVFDGKILEETVCKAIWEPFTPIPRWKVWVMGSGLPYYWNDCIGKTLFLTREAAEDALKGERGAAEI